MCLAQRGSSSTIYAWGRASEAQLGNGTEGTHVGIGKKRRRTNVLMPCPIQSLNGLHVRAIACGDGNSACVLARGGLYTWGEATLGKCGHGFHQERQLLPNLVRGALTDERVTDVSLGFEHSGCITERCVVCLFFFSFPFALLLSSSFSSLSFSCLKISKSQNLLPMQQWQGVHMGEQLFWSVRSW